MLLNNILKQVERRKKREGRGTGSGKGKTSSRGQKGQKARGSVPASFTGGGLPLYRKLPLRRGWGNRKVSAKPVVVTLEDLNAFKESEEVNVESLIKLNLVPEKEAKVFGVKVLNIGEVNKPLTVSLPISKTAALKIVKAGGKVV